MIQLPVLSFRQSPIVAKAAFRPMRQSGVRIEREQFPTRTVIHNYGHGGSGISIGYGSCLEAVSLALSHTHQKKASVLGMGIIGMTTALLLLEKGFQVTLYSKQYPFEQSGDEMASTVAMGYFMPIKVRNIQKVVRQAEDTWHHYISLMHKIKGITKIPTFLINNEGGELGFQIDSIMKFSKVKVKIGQTIFNADYLESLIVETKPYFQYLLERLNSYKGFRLVRREVTEEGMADIDGLVFNCLGYNNFFKDPSAMIGIKGHVLQFRPIEKAMKYLLFAKMDKNSYVLQGPHVSSDRLCLGISFDYQNKKPGVEERMVKKLVDDANRFYRQCSMSSTKL